MVEPEVAQSFEESQGETSPEPPESSSSYFQSLKAFRCFNCDFGAGYSYPNSDYQDIGNFDSTRLYREIRSLRRDLPCESSSAIFLCMDSARLWLMKALISGPTDTPYAHGLYLFEVALRGSYPAVPPLVRIATTGEGRVRFNPNLYDDGMVCLSLINTWEGSPEEMWDPARSTLLGVLVSIQALVMDNHILQKEPNYETYSLSDPANVAYTAVVRYNNIKFAMRKNIEHPPEEFKEVVWRHFSLKRAEIERTCEQWVSEAGGLTDFSGVDYISWDHNGHTIGKFQQKGYLACISKQWTKLKSALYALPPSPS